MSHCFLKGSLQCHTNKEENLKLPKFSSTFASALLFTLVENELSLEP